MRTINQVNNDIRILGLFNIKYLDEHGRSDRRIRDCSSRQLKGGTIKLTVDASCRTLQNQSPRKMRRDE